jgi:hypothetical protein
MWEDRRYGQRISASQAFGSTSLRRQVVISMTAARAAPRYRSGEIIAFNLTSEEASDASHFQRSSRYRPGHQAACRHL